MEVDAKTLVTIAVAIVGGGASGYGVTEFRTEIELAKLQVQTDNMRELVVTRIAEHKADNEALRGYVDSVADDINKRIDRLDARKADK